MKKNAILLPIAVLAVVLTACNGVHKDAPGPATNPTATTSAVSSTSSTASLFTSSTVVSAGEVKIPDTTGENFQTIVLGLNDLLNEVSNHPERPDLLDLVFEPSGSARTNTARQTANLRAKGWRYADQGATATNVSLQQRASSDTALVNLVTAQGPQIIVDSTGAVVERGLGWKPRHEQYTLKRGADGRWRIVTMVVNGPA